MTPLRITREWLVEHDAHNDAWALFLAAYPDGAELTRELLDEPVVRLNLEWLGAVLCGRPAYDKARKPINVAHTEGMKPINALYEEGMNKLDAAYAEAIKPIYAAWGAALADAVWRLYPEKEESK